MRNFVLYCFLLSGTLLSAQENSVNKGDVALNLNIGTPHLFKALTKAVVKSQVFRNNFNGYISVSNVSGMNPVFLKGEYTFKKWFALGLNYGTWNIMFDVTDHYNLQNQTVGALVQDSVDTYSIKISSTSIGLRPVFHFNLKDRKNNFYFAFGVGLTSNSIGISFRSTDAGRSLGPIAGLLEHDLSLPGTVYIAPTLGYRHYFNNWLGFNLEAGYDKGALLLGGLAIRFNVLSGKSQAE